MPRFSTNTDSMLVRSLLFPLSSLRSKLNILVSLACLQVHKLAIDAAIASGVSHVIYSSLGFGGLPSPDTPPTTVAQVMLAHIQTENYLASLHASNPSFNYSVVRQGLYTESFPIYTAVLSLTNPPPSGEILIPHDGSGPGISWVKRDELGEATAKILLMAFNDIHDPAFQPFLNTTILLSGPKSYSLAETVSIIGNAIGKDLKIRQVSVQEYANQPQVRASLDYGGGEVWPVLWATAWEGIRRGETANVTPFLEQLLGRKPESFEETIRQMVKDGQQ